MPRNETLPLTDYQLATVAKWSNTLFLADSVSEKVTLEYVKRPDKNGVCVASSSTGVIVGFNGAESNLAVTLDTADKGPRTINLVGLTNVRSEGTESMRCEDCQTVSVDVTARGEAYWDRFLCDACKRERDCRGEYLRD